MGMDLARSLHCRKLQNRERQCIRAKGGKRSHIEWLNCNTERGHFVDHYQVLSHRCKDGLRRGYVLMNGI